MLTERRVPFLQSPWVLCRKERFSFYGMEAACDTATRACDTYSRVPHSIPISYNDEYNVLCVTSASVVWWWVYHIVLVEEAAILEIPLCTEVELRVAAEKNNARRAAGPDMIPREIVNITAQAHTQAALDAKNGFWLEGSS